MHSGGKKISSKRELRRMRSETLAIHGGYEVDPTTKSVAVPVDVRVSTKPTGATPQ